MDDVTDLNRLRVERAKSSADITPVMAMREALRQIESGEWPVTSVMVVGMVDDGEATLVTIQSGGPSSSYEFAGVALKAASMMAKV